MLHQPTIEKLIRMRLQGMVDGLEALEQEETAHDLSFEEKLALLVDRQYTWRQNLAFQQRLKRARLRGNACVEDIDYPLHRTARLRYLCAAYPGAPLRRVVAGASEGVPAHGQQVRGVGGVG